ncbi:hypothetical protein QE152_g30540 [Popillia japonica]|uniref:Uncharacterized protein n=1 Tax=Popillia japonica TaxID=7064 RepID=A0AAW1JDH3_POPJA
MVASHHRPLERVREPNVRTCGSSRTEQDYYRNDRSSVGETTAKGTGLGKLAGGGAKLPSVGLCLNASKAVSFLVKGGNDTLRSSESRKAQNNVTLLGDRRSRRSSHEPLLAARGNRRTAGSHRYVPSAPSGRPWTTYVPGGVLYSVEQFPRCDLLRLSPLLGDSSCRLGETPGRSSIKSKFIAPENSSDLVSWLSPDHSHCYDSKNDICQVRLSFTTDRSVGDDSPRPSTPSAPPTRPATPTPVAPTCVKVPGTDVVSLQTSTTTALNLQLLRPHPTPHPAAPCTNTRCSDVGPTHAARYANTRCSDVVSAQRVNGGSKRDSLNRDVKKFTGPRGNGGSRRASLNRDVKKFTGPRGNGGSRRASLNRDVKKFTGPRGNGGSRRASLNSDVKKFTGPRGNGGSRRALLNRDVKKFTGPRGNGGSRRALLNRDVKKFTGPRGNGGSRRASLNSDVKKSQDRGETAGVDVHHLIAMDVKKFTGPRGNGGSRRALLNRGVKKFTGPRGKGGSRRASLNRDVKKFTAPRGNGGSRRASLNSDVKKSQDRGETAGVEVHHLIGAQVPVSGLVSPALKLRRSDSAVGQIPLSKRRLRLSFSRNCVGGY